MSKPDHELMDTAPVLLRSESLISRQAAETGYQRLLAINSGQPIKRCPTAVTSKSPVDLTGMAKDIATRILRVTRNGLKPGQVPIPFLQEFNNEPS